MTEATTLRKRLPVTAILMTCIFATVFALISFVNHTRFRTHAFDLGHYTHAVRNYAHFDMYHSTVFGEDRLGENIMADHFEPILMVVSPLWWIFGGWTLLVVQWAAILLGGWGMYVYLRARTDKPWLAELAMLHFYGIWGIYSALAFDYHNNVVAAMLVPWFAHFLGMGRWKPATVFFILILMCKEPVALWMVFVCSGLAWLHRRDKPALRLSLMYAVASLAWFLLVMKVVMPALRPEGQDYNHLRFTVLGENGGEALKYVVTHPWEAFKLLFVNHHYDNHFDDGLKVETWKMLALCGGVLFLIRPVFFWMLLPIFFQKFYNDGSEKWGINFHYSIEFVPVLALAFAFFLLHVKKPRLQLLLAAVISLTALISTLVSLNNRKSEWYIKENSYFLLNDHYTTNNYKRDPIIRALKLIPPDVPVAAQDPLLPHLLDREKLYLLPTIMDAEYIVAHTILTPYPMRDHAHLESILNDRLSSGEWEKIFDEKGCVVLKKKTSATVPVIQ